MSFLVRICQVPLVGVWGGNLNVKHMFAIQQSSFEGTHVLGGNVVEYWALKILHIGLLLKYSLAKFRLDLSGPMLHAMVNKGNFSWWVLIENFAVNK